jgi:hypothetical protein
MCAEKLLESLRAFKNGSALDEETIRIIAKIENNKRLSSQEFLWVFDAIWREGPKTAYVNPEAWRKAGDTV